MLELLETFREGASYDGALVSVYGFDTGGLDQQWRTNLDTPVEAVKATGGVQPVLIAVFAGLAAVVILLLSLFAVSRAQRQVK